MSVIKKLLEIPNSKFIKQIIKFSTELTYSHFNYTDKSHDILVTILSTQLEKKIDIACRNLILKKLKTFNFNLI